MLHFQGEVAPKNVPQGAEFRAGLFRRNDLHGLVEFEGQHRLRRHPDGPALGQDLGQSSAPGAGSYSDRGALPSTCDGTDNRAESSAATRVFGGSLVRYDDAVTASNSPGGPQGVTAIRLHVSGVDVRWASPLGRCVGPLSNRLWAGA
jgi:hypothetical protein